MTKPRKRKGGKVDGKTLLVCVNRRLSCGERGGLELAKALERMAADNPKSGVRVRRLVCLGKCERGPNIRRYGGQLHSCVGTGELAEIFAEAITADN